MYGSWRSAGWLLWCVSWAAAWFVLGFHTFGLTWVLALTSLGLAFMPIGRSAENLSPGPRWLYG